MKCIGKNCRYYYYYHQFRYSYRICALDDTSFKDDNHNCSIERILADKTENLKELKNYVEYIKQKNN